MAKDDSHRLQDPFLNLSVPSPATSISFMPRKVGGKFSDINDDNDDSNDGSSSDDDEDEEPTFRSSWIQSTSQVSSKVREMYKRQNLLKARLLVSCHKNGEALLWDCARQSKAANISGNGAGIAVKRIEGEDGLFLYQTRDVNGTVAIHALDRLDNASSSLSVVQRYETYSATFCQAAPCRGNPHLIALPSRQESIATVMDTRDPKPIHVTTHVKDAGMVTSLAMCTTNGTGRPVLGCGMENGSVILYDFASGKSTKGTCPLTKDPILALDLSPSEAKSSASSTTTNHPQDSVVAVAGMAGDIVEVAELPEAEQGRVALLKASLIDASNSKNANSDGWTIKTRARLSTCRVDQDTSYGKPGVAICKFRPQDDRIFAVGGWDNRVRLFERSVGAAMGILRGHLGSVNALDWAPDAVDSGLLATAGGQDSCISFWHCFGK